MQRQEGWSMSDHYSAGGFVEAMVGVLMEMRDQELS